MTSAYTNHSAWNEPSGIRARLLLTAKAAATPAAVILSSVLATLPSANALEGLRLEQPRSGRHPISSELQCSRCFPRISRREGSKSR